MKWKKIEGYDNYSVSDEGNVRNDKTGLILKARHDKDGYETVTLCKNGKIKTFRVHRLVAETFLPNPLEFPCVDHINTIRNDNCIENLRWCSYKQNINNPLTVKKLNKSRNSEETKRKLSEAHKGENNPRCRKVILLNTGEIFDYMKQASEKYGASQSDICSCCKGKRKSAGKLNGEKLVWMYLEDYLKGEKING